MDDIVKEFLIESNENLDRLDRNLVELEKSPRNQDLLADIFRTIHSIKGTTGFLGFHHLESVAHAGENLLSHMRDGLLILNPTITSGLLAMVDAIREMLALIEATEADGENDYSELITKINALQAGASEIAEAPAETPTQPAHKVIVEVAPVLEHPVPEIQVHENSEEERPNQDVLAPVERRGGSADSAIRVDVALLERLMDLVGELVLTRNQIIQHAAGQRDSAFLAVSQRLNLVTSDMREIIMKTRLQPIQNVMGKFPRMVRDLALSCGKKVRIETTGQETELDRTILEAIKDPLSHAVRNSVDHGIETPEVRAATGKTPEGCLKLRAFHEGGQVNIEITDDGAGIDPARVRAKAIDKGLITAQQADRMSAHEIISLVFQPGFSTAEKVTNVSGRGVGMDVVRTNIEKIGGTVDIQSTLGQGSTVRMKIPLTLAIIPVLIVHSAGQRFAIPQVSLLELLRLEANRAKQAIEMVHGAPVYRLRGSLLPLLFLRSELQQSQSQAGQAADDRELNIVVLQAEGQHFGLVVDEIHDTEEIVVKPLGKHLKHIAAFSGATVMGDGEVALILDVMGLAQGGRLLTEAKKTALLEAASTAGTVRHDIEQEKQELLLFRTAQGRRTAVALSSVDRLEEFKVSQFEKAGQKLVVQYRGELLPIVNLSDQFHDAQSGTTQALLQVLVCSHQGRRLGIVVDQILDVAEEPVVLEPRWKDSLSKGSAVVQKQVTDFLDLSTMFDSAQEDGSFAHSFGAVEIAQ